MTTELFDKVVFSAEFAKNCLKRVTGILQTSKKEEPDPDADTEKVTQGDRLSKKSEVIPD
jgi:hypothetical protein